MLLQGNCIADRHCESCSFREECVVQQIYYHSLKIVPDFVQGKESLGYLYECSDTRTRFEEGDELRFQILLFGNVIVHFPVILQAMYRLGMFGLGRENAVFRLVQIENQRGEKILQQDNVYLNHLKPDTLSDYVKKRYFQLPTPTEMRFVTPLAQKHEGRFLTSFQEDALVDSIYRRIYLLNCMEGNQMERWCPFRGSLQIESQTVQEAKIPRYSGTQDKIIYLSGIEGKLQIKVKEEFLPYLLVGELTHIGKNTSMGFGKYVLRKTGNKG